MEFKQIAKYNNNVHRATTEIEGSISKTGHYYTLQIDDGVSKTKGNITRTEARTLIDELTAFIG